MAEQTLTAEDLQRYRTALAEGGSPTVYLVEAVPTLGLAAGASARIQDVAGTTVTVKPAGINDVLPFEARELRATKQPITARPVKRTRGASGAKSVAVTVHVGADNTASVKISRNAARPTGADDVSIGAVHKALDGLGNKDAKAAVADVLNAARMAAADRVSELQAELLSAKKSLAALDRAKRGNAGTGRAR